jgi:adenine C2-methylase RlmN of 23S rRNA A2503 and tRNA A37
MHLQVALGVILDSRLFSLSPKHVTVSTVGVTDKIRALATDIPAARLALSLHAPTQVLRESIVPSAKAYKLPALMQALQDYLTITQGRAFIEYVMLQGVNDELQHARELGELLRVRSLMLSLCCCAVQFLLLQKPLSTGH